MVMARYWNDDESTQMVMKDGWLTTGDLMQIDDEGFLHFKTRKDDVINKSGFQIFPEKIEQVLLAHPKIAQAAVIGVSDPRKKQEVKACVILVKDETASSEEIIEYCREQMPNYQCPQIIQFYDSFPKSPTGKVLKRVLRES